MPSLSSTISSLSSISEDSTYGVEGEDLPPTLPRRRRSFGSRSVSTTEASVGHHNDVETLESIHEETREEEDVDVTTRPRQSSGRRRTKRRSHHSSRHNDDSQSTTSEEKKDENRTKQRRRSRSSTSRSHHSSQESSAKSEQDGSDRAAPKEGDRTEMSRRSSSRKRRSSSNRQRSSSNTSSDSNEDLADTSDGSQEKAKEKARRKNSKSSSSRRSSSSSASSRRDATTNGDDESSSKQTIVEERRHYRRSSSGSSSRSRGGRRSHSSSRRSLSLSSRHSSEWAGSRLSSQSDSDLFSRNLLDRRGSRHEFITRTSSGSHDDDDNNNNSSSEEEDDERPGAYRVSTHRPTSRVTSLVSSLSSSMTSGHSFAVVASSSDENVVLTDSTRSLTSSREDSLSLSASSTMVRAEVARDITEEIAAAREQGRAEALTEVSSHHHLQDNSDIVVAVVQPSSRRKEEGDNRRRRRRKSLIMLFGWCCCMVFFIMISGGVGYFVLLTREDERNNYNNPEQDGGTSVPEGDDSSELDAVISFDPPTAEDCASVANGTAVAGQEDMITKYIDMHVEITTNSKEDAALLVRLLKEQVQLNLIPFLIGCDDLVGNVIGNGVVDSVSNATSTCLFVNNPNCLEVVLTVKIYLRRNKEDGSTVIEFMSNLLVGKELNDSLALPRTVQAASVSLIEPSSFATDEQMTETPSVMPMSTSSDNTFGTPSLMPNTTPGPSVKPTPLQTAGPTMEPSPAILGPSPVPTTRPVLDDYPPDTTLTIRPTSARTPRPKTPIPTTITPQPTPEPTTSVPITTDSPSLGPTTAVPIPGAATPLPTSIIAITPSPSTISPTHGPTFFPTDTPSFVPSNKPSRTPSLLPSVAPSMIPSSGPSISPSTLLPSRTPSISPTACTADTKVVPLFDAGIVDSSYYQVYPGAVSSTVQRFSCLAGAASSSTDLGILSYNEADCTVKCLYTVPFSAFESYCSSNPAGGFSFSIPGPPFTEATSLYIGHKDNSNGNFDLTCEGGQLSLLNVDSSTPIGCYADAQKRAMVGTERLTSSTITVQQCLDRCFQAGFLYAGLENGRDCFCDDNYMRYGKLQDSRCRRNCVDGLLCGGDWAMSVYPTGVDGHDGDYTPVPSAAPIGDQGCWNEDPAMVLVATLNPVYVVRCVEHCLGQGKMYAGLRNLDNRNKCYCGDAYQAGGVASTCDRDCAGPCGGVDSWNIYATTP